jgi:Voltage-dependent anion channel
VPPSAGAVVMGTGIVSIALADDGFLPLSRALLVLTALAWATLALLTVVLVARRPDLARERSRTPGGLTAVAATAVLGSRLAVLARPWAAAALLALALCLWAALVPRVLRAPELPPVGTSFMLAVSTESLAVLASQLGIAEGAPWLAAAAIAFAGLGLLAYALVLRRFALRQLLVGRGDHWVSGGALAIATLACGSIAEAAGRLTPLHAEARALDDAALVLWAAATAWLPALIVCELLARRRGYDIQRWATLFPVGMYAACSFVVGNVRSAGGLTGFARAWTWVAFALWLLVAAALARQATRALRRALAAAPGR